MISAYPNVAEVQTAAAGIRAGQGRVLLGRVLLGPVLLPGWWVGSPGLGRAG